MSRPDLHSPQEPPAAGRIAPWVAASLSASAFIVPIAMSASAVPAPVHPVTFAWYLSLRKPWFKPPDALIPLAWTGIEAGLAVAGYRLARAAPSKARTRALALLGWNVVAIGGWSRLFFGRRNLGGSTALAASMVATGAVFVQQAGHVDKTAARSGMPLVLWVGFATVLTAAIWRLNMPRR